MTDAKRKTRKSISNVIKLAGIDELEKKKKKTQQQIATELGVNQSTVSAWMKKKPKLTEIVAAGQGTKKTMHQEQYPIVSKALLACLTARSKLSAPAPGLTSYSLMAAKCKSLAVTLASRLR